MQELFKLIKEKFKCKISEEENSSGTDIEPASELDQALRRFVHWKNLSWWKLQAASKVKQKKYVKKQWKPAVRPKQDWPVMKLVRNQNKKRRGGNESIEFPQEKFEQELEVRKKSLIFS